MSVDLETKQPENVLPQCLLDRDRLRRIELSINSIHDKVDTLLSHDGPISDLKQRISSNEAEASRAHGRIDTLRYDLKNEVSTTNSFIAKVLAFAGGVSALVAALVTKFLG